eukprot:3623101-Pyramimonas_sp.AAC.1
MYAPPGGIGPERSWEGHTWGTNLSETNTRAPLADSIHAVGPELWLLQLTTMRTPGPSTRAPRGPQETLRWLQEFWPS